MLEVTYEEKVKNGRQLTKEEAIKLLEDCLQILFHRDCNAHNRVRKFIQKFFIFIKLNFHT